MTDHLHLIALMREAQEVPRHYVVAATAVSQEAADALAQAESHSGPVKFFRLSNGGYMVQMTELPENPDDELDN